MLFSPPALSGLYELAQSACCWWRLLLSLFVWTEWLYGWMNFWMCLEGGHVIIQRMCRVDCSVRDFCLWPQYMCSCFLTIVFPSSFSLSALLKLRDYFTPIENKFELALRGVWVALVLRFLTCVQEVPVWVLAGTPILLTVCNIFPYSIQAKAGILSQIKACLVLSITVPTHNFLTTLSFDAV
jgi:hypothetical protein